jgi:hypothetical protein
MRLGSALTVLLAAASALVATPAQARPATAICDLVRDATGDAQLAPGVADPTDASTGDLDIVSGDIASTRDVIGVAIRLVKLPALHNIKSSTSYDFYFDSADQTFDFNAILPASGDPSFELVSGPSAVAPTGDDAYATYSGEGIAPAHGVIDYARNEIRMTISLKTIRKVTKLTSPVHRLRIETWRDSPTPTTQAGYREDMASGDRQYRDEYQLGRRSCLRLTGSGA